MTQRNIIPISLRKLKKLKKNYVVRIPCKCVIAYSAFSLSIYVHSHTDILKYPNLYINKKFVNSRQTHVNRYRPYCTFNKVVVNTNHLDGFVYKTDITIYAVFDSESEYLKLKLSI